MREGGRARLNVGRRREGGIRGGLRAQRLNSQRGGRVRRQVAGEDEEEEGEEKPIKSHKSCTANLNLRYRRLGRSVSRILSGRGMQVYAPKGFVPAPCLGDHLSRRRVAAPLKRPTRDWQPPSRRSNIRRRAASSRPQTVSSLLGLAPGGGYLAARIAASAGGLLHRLFTLTPGPSPDYGRGASGAVCFCGPDPAG